MRVCLLPMLSWMACTRAPVESWQTPPEGCEHPSDCLFGFACGAGDARADCWLPNNHGTATCCASDCTTTVCLNAPASDAACVLAQAERVKSVMVSGEMPPRQTLDHAAIDRLEVWIA